MLEELLAEVLRVRRSEISEETGPANCARWDSAGVIKLVTALEKAYSVRFSIQEVLEMDSLAAIRKQLRKKGIPG